jgi:hypothetical protein
MGQSSSILQSETIYPKDQYNEKDLSDEKPIKDPKLVLTHEEVRAQDPTHQNGIKRFGEENGNHNTSSITQLSKDEIKDRLDKIELSPYMFRYAAKLEGSFSEKDTFVWYCNQQSSKTSSDLEETYMEIALYILSISPSVRSLRFKLVPGKLSEGKFWLILFDYICYGSESRFEKDPKSTIESSNYMKNDSLDGGMEALVQRLKLKIKKQEEEIQKLRMTVDKLQANGNDGMTIGNGKSHAGKWIMDKEAIEFLSLEEEIKQQLREGKKKRMYEMNEQMKFILDSDHIKDSRGKWDCCGKIIYCSDCNC